MVRVAAVEFVKSLSITDLPSAVSLNICLTSSIGPGQLNPVPLRSLVSLRAVLRARFILAPGY